MDPNPARPPLTTYDEVARLVEYSLHRPELTSQDVAAALEKAMQYGIAAASVRPSDLDLAVRMLEGSAVKPGSVSGFPHGNANTATKLYEIRDLLRRGAKEISVVINYARLLSREFQAVQTELVQASEACRKDGASLYVILETHYLTTELKIIACQCCERADVHAVRTATGFAPTLGDLDDLRLMRKYLPDDIGIQAAGIGTLDALLEVYQAGCDRAGIAAPEPLLENWKQRVSRASDAVSE